MKLINDCNCTVDVFLLEEVILWYSKNKNQRLRSIKHIYMHGNYPAITIGKEKSNDQETIIGISLRYYNITLSRLFITLYKGESNINTFPY